MTGSLWWLMPLLATAVWASPPQLIAGASRQLRCDKVSGVVRVARDIADDANPEVCRAVHVAWRALQSATGRSSALNADSVHAVLHSFPVLGTNTRRSLYQLGFYLTGRDYREVVVDRANWAAEVLGRETFGYRE